VVLVSHDRHLIRNTVEQLLLVANGQVTAFDGDLDDYSRWLLSDKGAPSQAGEGARGKVQDRKEQRRQAAGIRQQLSPLKKELTKLEKTMDQLQSRLAVIEEALSDTGLYCDDKRVELNGFLQEQGQLKNRLDDSEERWLALQQEIETMETLLGA
jgi:ATP-binding cassette subfamily F protein 3